MKKTQKQVTRRKLILAREVVVQLEPRELAHVAGGSGFSGPPRCSQDLAGQG